MSGPSRPVRGFVPIGDVAGTLPGVVPSGRVMSAQTRHHFTTMRQVNQLIEASEAEPDLGFMARLLALCSLPRTNPGDRKEYVRRNGPYTLIMSAGGQPAQLPYGILPRLLLAWVCSEAVRTQRRQLVLGRSLYEFMHKLGMKSHSGGERGDRTRLKNQMRRLFRCSVQLVYADSDHEVQIHSFIADRAEYWWHSSSRPDTPGLWESTIQLGEQFFNEIIRHPIPLDLHNPQGAQAVAARVGFVFLARLSDVFIVGTAHALLATAPLPVRGGPSEGYKARLGQPLPRGGLARAEKNQNRVARLELPHGDGWARRLALDPTHHAHTTPVDRRVVDRRPSRPHGLVGCSGRPYLLSELQRCGSCHPAGRSGAKDRTRGCLGL